MATYSNKSLSLNAKDARLMDEVSKKGWSLIDVFRLGMKYAAITKPERKQS